MVGGDDDDDDDDGDEKRGDGEVDHCDERNRVMVLLESFG